MCSFDKLCAGTCMSICRRLLTILPIFYNDLTTGKYDFNEAMHNGVLLLYYYYYYCYNDERVFPLC